MRAHEYTRVDRGQMRPRPHISSRLGPEQWVDVGKIWPRPHMSTRLGPVRLVDVGLMRPHISTPLGPVRLITLAGELHPCLWYNYLYVQGPSNPNPNWGRRERNCRRLRVYRCHGFGRVHRRRRRGRGRSYYGGDGPFSSAESKHGLSSTIPKARNRGWIRWKHEFVAGTSPTYYVEYISSSFYTLFFFF